MVRIKNCRLLSLTKTKDEKVRIDSDSALLHAFDVYWDCRKLPLTVQVVDIGPRLLQSQFSSANALLIVSLLLALSRVRSIVCH